MATRLTIDELRAIFLNHAYGSYSMQTIPCFSCHDSGKCRCPTCGGSKISPIRIPNGATKICGTCYGGGCVRCYVCRY